MLMDSLLSKKHFIFNFCVTYVPN